MKNENLYLVLGCFGRREGEFIYCPSVSNRILHVHSKLIHYDELMDYLDGLRLFDKPLFDLNATRHMIYYIQDRFEQRVRKIWAQRDFELYEKFLNGHKNCGIYSRLILAQEEDNHEEKPDIENIEYAAEENVQKKPELKLIRGKRY